MAKRPATAELMGDFRRFTELTVRAINTEADTRNEVATVLTSVENETGPTYQPLPQIAKHSASSSSPFLSLSLSLSNNLFSIDQSSLIKLIGKGVNTFFFNSKTTTTPLP